MSATPRAPATRGADDPRAVLRGLGETVPFAPALPARSGGWPVGALVAGFALVVHLLCIAREITDPATGHRLVLLVRDGLASGAGGGLWCAAARLCEGLPLGGTPAWRAALPSALASAAAAGLLAVWLRQRDIGRRAAAVGGLLFAFTLPVWVSAALPGPLPIAACLALLVLVLIEESRATRHGLARRIAWVLAGVVAAQGPEALAMIAAVIAQGALRPGALPHRRALAPALFCAGAALALLAGRAAWSAPWVPHPAGWDPPLPIDAIAAVARASGPVGIGALLGALALYRKHPGDAGALALLGGIPVVAALLLGARGTMAGDPPEIARAVPLAHAALAALAASGIDVVLQRFAATPSPRAHTLTAASAAFPLVLLAIGSTAADHSESRTAVEWSESVLRGLPPDAIVVAGPDPRGGLLEAEQLLGDERPDVLLADPAGRLEPVRSPLLELDPPPADAGAAIAAIAARTSRPLFALAPVETPGGRWSPWGIVWRLERSDAASAAEEESAWAEVRFTHLPGDPAGARAWIDGELDVPPRDRTTRRIAADYFQALARREGALDESGRWGAVLARLPELR